MKPIIFMFYYVNIPENVSTRHAQEVMMELINHVRIRENDYEGYTIIQQYFPVRGENTRVEVITVPNVSVNANDNLANQINNNMKKIVGHYESMAKINNVEDLYG